MTTDVNPDTMSLYEYRQQFPWCRPYARVKHLLTGREMEIVSFPWPELGTHVVNAREIDDPTTMEQYAVNFFEPMYGGRWQHSDEYYDGYRAAEQGDTPCPHQEDTPQWEEWRAGYDAYHTDVADRRLKHA